MSARADLESFLGALDGPEGLQDSCLRERIVGPNRECEYGRRYGFASIATIRDYQHAVPIVRYSEIAYEIDRMAGGEAGVLVTEPVRRFFLTSGSSAAPKLIPVTSSFIGDKSRAFGMYWTSLFDAHPDAPKGRVVGNFSESGGGYKLPSGIPVSSEGAYWNAVGAAAQQRGKSPLPKFVGAIGDSSARYYTVARILAEEDLSLLLALNPSTVLLLLRTMNERRDTLIEDVERGGLTASVDVSAEVRDHVAGKYPGNPTRAAERRAILDDGDPELPALPAHRVWPGLEMMVSWRSPMQRPYLKLLEPHLGPVGQRDYILMASEGIIAIPVEDQVSGGLLATGIHFYEFIPEEEAERPDPTVRLAHELEVGRNYVVVLSTSGGLYRYNISDVVRVRALRGRTPVVEFLYRTGATSSITGEKLTEEQVVAAVGALAARVALPLEGFTLLPAPDGFPRYVLLAELSSLPDRAVLQALPRQLDAELQERNIEYGAKRRSQRLEAPEVWLVERGGYETLRRKRIADGSNDAQIKPVGLTRDAAFATNFQVTERFP